MREGGLGKKLIATDAVNNVKRIELGRQSGVVEVQGSHSKERVNEGEANHDRRSQEYKIDGECRRVKEWTCKELDEGKMEINT